MTAEQAISWLSLKPKDLPVFVLIGTDPFAPGVIRKWGFDALKEGVNHDKVRTAFKVSSQCEAWPEKKLPG